MKMFEKFNKRKRLLIGALITLISGATFVYAQPGPQPPGSPLPPPESPAPPPMGQPGGPPPAPGSGPLQSPPPPGWGYSGFLASPPSGDWMNQGYLNVMATGYDTESVLVQIPLYVNYSFNGVNYDVMVLNSWDPYTQTWNVGVDSQAFQTSYFFNGFTYNYYVNLPSGTFYFNL